VTTWLISDSHFGEQPKRRCLNSGLSGNELDALIISNWRENVRPADVVWHLGDIGKNWRVLTDLPGVKHLILAHASDRRAAIAKSGIFDSIQEGTTLETPAGQLFLVHDPDPWERDERNDIVHGHHHYRGANPGRRTVCVDHTGWAPIELSALIERPPRICQQISAA
jgi:calcineurin-like phosphoesterase family protein